MTNTLYYGDNLHVLRDHVRAESVDLIYLDPPFNSNANYNILFKSPEGHNSDAQIEAFEDTWHWNDTTIVIPSFSMLSIPPALHHQCDGTATAE